MVVSRRRFGCGAVLATTIIAGCAPVYSIPSPFVSCDRIPPGVFDEVNWEAARRINMRVRHGEFEPSLIRLYQGKPYVMRLENRDRSAQRFHSSEFFEALFVHSIIRSDGAQSDTCPSGVRLSPGEVVEIRFIAARDGRYEYRASGLPFVLGGIPDGIAQIEIPPMLAALMPPAIPGVTKPDDEIPVGPYTPASAPVVPPAPEAPPAAEPAAMPVIPPSPDTPPASEPAVAPVMPPAPETPAMPTEPSALPVPMPAPETPAMPSEPAVAPMVPPEPEAPPAIPTEPVTLPVPLPAPEIPPATEPTVAPVMPSAPETPAMPAEPSALPVPMPAPETPSATEPAVAPVMPSAPETPAMPAEPSVLPLPMPAPEAPPAAEPAATPFLPPAPEGPPAGAPAATPSPILDKPRPLAPEHAPGNLPAPGSGGVGLFGQ
jgi:hypothetical protein